MIVMEQPIKSDASIDPHSYRDFGISPDPSHRPLYLHHVRRLLADLPRGSAVLDAGCGGGDFAIGLHELGLDVYGLDLSESAISHARSLEVARFETGSLSDNLNEPFDVAEFKAILAIEVIEHLYSPNAFAKRAYEALAPGGMLIVTTPYWGYLKNIVLAVTNRMDRSLTALWEGGHIKHFSRTTLTNLMRAEGFQEIAFIGCGEGWRPYLPYLWSGMLMAFRKPA